VTALATIRQRQVPWARRTLGMFVVVWLNLVLQPCAMALGGEIDHDCPHCPPSHERQHDSHNMASNEMPCATGAADCDVLDEFDYDGRLSQLKLKDPRNDLPVAIISVTELLAGVRHSRVEKRRPTHNAPPGYPIPLNVLYCVYLD
jgi:hypothetical protein